MLMLLEICEEPKHKDLDLNDILRVNNRFILIQLRIGISGIWSRNYCDYISYLSYGNVNYNFDVSERCIL